MAKQLTSQKFVYKIHSTHLRKEKWKLKITPFEAVKNDELISLADSQVMRFINDINEISSVEIDNKVKEIRKKIKQITKQEKSQENFKIVKELYSELNNIQIVPEYVCIIIDNNTDFKRACKGFKINNLKYKRFVGTTNGVKKNTIVFVCEENSNGKKVYSELHKRVENGRNQSNIFIPAKFEAYKSLSCSASIPVSYPEGIIVVKDCFTKFKSSYIKLDDTNDGEPTETIIENEEIELDSSDGYGLITKELAKRWSDEIKEEDTFSGCCIRNSYCKGMLFVFDFKAFANEYAENNYMVKDVWGNFYDIRNVEMILTESMLKLWDSYNCLEDYLNNCYENKYTFAITKIVPKELENCRDLNYQFIQTYDLTDEEIYQLCLPTINEIKSILGLNVDKTILFLKGISVDETNVEHLENDIGKALMIDNSLINDPHIRSKIYQLIKKRINQAKIGKLKVNGNFQVVCLDPFALCQSIFKLDITGLMSANECYSDYWINKQEEQISCFRAPMSCHNNIRLLNLTKSKDCLKWYKHMNNVMILNVWDMTTHALNGMDTDGDLVFSTNNSVLIKNTKNDLPILCLQRTAKKLVITEDELIKSNKNSFGDEIGSTTNKITSMTDKKVLFNKDSKEYKTLDYRIRCGQLFQQNAIDKTKGIEAKPIPKEWYDSSVNKIKIDKDGVIIDNQDTIDIKLFNQTIIANKKPYFMNYIYPSDMAVYKKYIQNSNKKCYMQFGISIENLINKENKTEEENLFLNYYHKQIPSSMNDCVMNRICKLIEKTFDNYINNTKEIYPEFDYNILKSQNIEYDKSTYKKIYKLYEEYSLAIQDYMQLSRKNRYDSEEITIQKNILKQEFKKKCLMVCCNKYELCNILVDICYSNNKSKQFAWDICSDVITENLLKLNDNMITYLLKDKNGDIEFNGEYFIKKKIQINKDEDK